MDFRDNIWQHAKKCTKVLNLACGLVSLSNRFNTSSIRRSDSFGCVCTAGDSRVAFGLPVIYTSRSVYL